MKKRLRILYLSSEVAPFAKTGGLADVSSALPKALLEMGHDIRVMMPKYGTISDRRYVLREVIRLKQIKIQMGETEHIASAKSAFIPDSKVQVYFIEYPPCYNRDDLYVDPKTNKDYPDNAERFALFCKSVLETIKLLHWEPQIIHCNDWQTALIPWYLKNEYSSESFASSCRTVLSIHNMAYQGGFSMDALEKMGESKITDSALEDIKFFDGINFLKAGILTADRITTVSPTYANEVLTDPEIGAGMQEFLEKRKDSFEGILNGVDYSEWDPEKDATLEHMYTKDDLDGKLENKKLLLEKCEFKGDPEKPLIGIVSRIAEQKGFDLIIDAVKDIVAADARMVILGTGDEKYQKQLSDIASKYKKNVALFLTFDNDLAHLIEAGSDIFLMPSRYEPSGLNQMYSLKYGTIPVVRKTGGLADSILDYQSDPDKGNGFVFESYDSGEMVKAIKSALDVYKDQKKWKDLMVRAMSADFSWQVAADKYMNSYSQIIQTKK